MLSASQDVRRLGHAPTASCRTATCRWCSNLRHSRQFKGRVVYLVFYRNMADSEDQALLQQQYQAMRMDANGLASKISELEQDHHEHELVLSAMDTLEPARKCFRLVGGVLVERTVAEVHPAVTSNKEKIKSVIESLRLYRCSPPISLQLAEKERIIREFVSMHKLNVGPNMPSSGSSQQAVQRQSQGILAGKA